VIVAPRTPEEVRVRGRVMAAWVVVCSTIAGVAGALELLHVI
jgi:hypothetical protein